MKKYLFLVIFVFILLGIVSSLKLFSIQPDKQSTYNSEVISDSKSFNKSFTYKGKEGVDALTLLKEQTSVEQDKSGLVTSINDKKADAQKKEYWAFYVNGKMAQVGPADYVTNDGDRIEWKLEAF